MTEAVDSGNSRSIRVALVAWLRLVADSRERLSVRRCRLLGGRMVSLSGREGTRIIKKMKSVMDGRERENILASLEQVV